MSFQSPGSSAGTNALWPFHIQKRRSARQKRSSSPRFRSAQSAALKADWSRRLFVLLTASAG
jgi:hypothetical protein